MAKRTITFGTWNHMPIEWIVLKEDDFKMLVVSECVLFNDYYNRSRRGAKEWSKSDIRAMLNGKFFSDAFDSKEKKKIVNVYLEEPNKTKDNVFLLSETEAAYLMTIEDRKYRGVWWLRSPAKSDTEVRNVSNDGNFHYNDWVDYSYGIRPAIYIKK